MDKKLSMKLLGTLGGDLLEVTAAADHLFLTFQK